MLNIIKLLFAIAVIFVIGWSLLKLIIRDRTKTSLAERIALSFGLGAGTLTIGMFLLSFSCFQLNLLNTLLLSTPFVVYLLWGYLLQGEKFKPTFLGAEIKNKLKEFNLVDIILIALILFIILLVFADALIQPMHGWDETGFWALKAKILYHDATIYSTDFFDNTRVHPHKHYPLLIPLVESWIYMVFGHVDDRLVKAIFPLFFVSLLLIFQSSQRKFFPRTHSLLFTALVASMPVIVVSKLPYFLPFITDWGNGAATGYADVPLSFFYFISVVYLYMWMRDTTKKDYLLIAAIFSVFTIFTKLEGIALFLCNLSVFIAFILFDTKQFTKQKAAQVLIYLLPLIVLLPWFIFQQNLPGDSGFQFTIENFIHHLYRLPVILAYFLNVFLNPLHWSIMWILVGLTTVFTFKETFKKPLIYLFLMLVLHLSAYICMYLLTPIASVEWHMSYSLNRMLAHIVPAIAFLVSTQTFVGELLPKLKVGHCEKR